MDGMNETPSEEYILAMRTAVFREDSDLWRERRAKPLKPGGEPFLTKKKGKSKSLLPMTEDHATKVLASLVPDEIIYNVDDYSNRHHNICILFGDVSGFTDLCEMYNKTGKGGPSRLTTVLNAYIGAMVQEVISHNGDILKFSGDAFLAAYKVSPNGSLQDVVHEAMDAAIMIQKSLGTYETDVGVVLKVKLAISAGHTILSLIGDYKNSYYVEVGQPILDVKAAEKMAKAGEIIVSPSAWNYVNPNEYLHELMSDGIHMKVKGVGVSWRPVQRNIADKAIKGDEEVLYSTSSSSRLFDRTESADSEEKMEGYGHEEFSIRPSVNYASKMNMKEDLRKFIIAPIMRSIDLDEPIEYLTEMRQIVIVFINIITHKIDWVEYVKLIDDIYKLICNVVTSMQGCVNKMSTFDKDLMFVILFGLRGYKNELESQMGLRCASQCYQAISKLPSVISTSVGVTTGVTYCGVVGHTLRREYTVISLTVNKAARLMCAYPDKVTCDRETFLHSKLEAGNFILQEPKPLKGITNVGPVYEFKEQLETQVKVTINSYPLLGRNQELEIYSQLVDECIAIHVDKGQLYTDQLLTHHNAFLIRGDSRIGKTRLLNELIFATQPEIPINKFNLREEDGLIPYRTIEYIFTVPLALGDLNTCLERETKLRLRLQKIKAPEFYCALNTVFGVGFDLTPSYLGLNNAQKIAVLEKILKQLCTICFKTLWVIAIDNVQFIDEKSWKFINIMIDMDIALIVMTMGKTADLSSAGLDNIMGHPRVQTCDLDPLDKWYHAGLACQILDVIAIPPELEKLIQTKSHGNPGWVESFLISLVQAGGLVIQRSSKEDINELGLVSPPLDMLIRIPNEERSPERCYRNDTGNLQDHWQMYKFSYRDSLINLMKEKMKEKSRKFGHKMQICIIAPNFKLEDLDPEFSMDVVIIKMFDSLTSFEQLILKCSSVLGEFFPRDMLLYIINSGTSRLTALAIKKLFELRVLGCAKGDFTQGEASVMMFQQKMVNPNEDTIVQCKCRGIKYEGLMFRETTYNLLTDTQKKDFHTRAIRYLEKQTRRCRACGNGYFVRILGHKYDEGFAKRAKRKSQVKSSTTSRLSITSGQTLSERSTIEAHSSYFSVGKSHRITSGNLGEGGFFSQRQPSDIEDATFCTGLRMIQRLRQSYSLTRTFSYADFSMCQCPLILDTMYTQMLEHCQGAEFIDRMIETLLEYAHICIISHNIPQAIKILNEAAIKLNDEKPKDIYNEDASWKIPLTKGKIETLTGHARLELGQLEAAYDCFQKALKYYGYTFPSKKISIKLSTLMFEIKQRLGMYFCPSLIVSSQDESESRFSDDVSDCLSLLCHLYKQVHMWDHAELAAAWSLAKALQSDMDFFGLCVAYTNMLVISHHLNKQSLCIALEIHALRLCHRKKSSVEADELKAVAMLYSAIFTARTLRAEIDRSIHIGFIMLRICTSIHSVQISLEVLPIMVHVLLIKRKLAEVVVLILELEYYSAEDTDNSGRIWYYALCVGYQLESGYTLTPFKKCEKFYQVNEETLINARDQDGVRRFYTVMWLWCLRNDDLEAATVWYTKAYDFVIVHNRDSLNNMFTSLYLLEGLLLMLVTKIDKRNIDSTALAYKEIDMLIKAIESCESAKIIIPRFYHLKAYYKYIKNDEPTALNALRKAKKLAEKQENLLETAWIEHSEKAWNNNLSAILMDFWKEHCESDNLIDYHEAELNEGKLGLFTLPTPMFY